MATPATSGLGSENAAPPVEEKKDAPKGAEDKGKLADENRKNFNPEPEHPRFKEVWKKLKTIESEKSELEKDIEAMRRHNQEVAARLEELNKSKQKEDPAPDPEIDPQGYKKWVELREAKREKEYAEREVKNAIARQIEIQSELHDDYDEVIKIAERDMNRDPEIKKKIWNSENPPKAAYKYGKKKMEEKAKAAEDEEKRELNNEKGDVLGGDNPPPDNPKEVSLSDDEKRVARRLFPELKEKEAYDKVLAQKKIMRKGA